MLQAERKRETRRKIGRAAQTYFQALKRSDDRALFGLDAVRRRHRPSRQPRGRHRRSRPGRRSCWPGSSRSIPELAREFGVDPDEPGLEKLDKAKATSLIGAMLERVNAQAPPDER